MAHSFNAAAYAAIPVEDASFITDLRDGAVATYHPANSQELFACERIALAQASLSRCAMLEAGFHTAFLSEIEPVIHPVDTQNPSLSLATGFSRTTSESDAFKLFLRYRDQCRREYRDARQDIVQLIKLRDTLDQPTSKVPEPTSPPVAENTLLTIDHVLTSIPLVRAAQREGPDRKPDNPTERFPKTDPRGDPVHRQEAGFDATGL